MKRPRMVKTNNITKNLPSFVSRSSGKYPFGPDRTCSGRSETAMTTLSAAMSLRTSTASNTASNFYQKNPAATRSILQLPGYRSPCKLELWIGDSGASSHMTNKICHVYDRHDDQSTVNIADGHNLDVHCSGKIDVTFLHLDGTYSHKTLQVKVVPKLQHDLFSFVRCMDSGWTMIGHKQKGALKVTLTLPGTTPVYFDRVLQNGKALLMGAQVIRHPHVESAQAVTMPHKMTKKRFHLITGHAGDGYLEHTAHHMGIELSGSIRKCLHCALEKMRQANIPKSVDETSTTPGERMYLDISSYKAKSLGSNRHWVMLVDEATRFKQSFFIKQKDHQNDLIVEWFKELKQNYKIIVKCVRCDNSGENNTLKTQCIRENLGVRFEYTTPGTPPTEWSCGKGFCNHHQSSKSYDEWSWIHQEKENSDVV